jgi:DNA-binding PadR family transcriptional regulator
MEPQMTKQTLSLLAAMIGDPSRPWYGLALMDAAGLKSGTVYPALARLERFGWVTSEWETVDPSEAKRPRRRLYTLTGEGQMRAIEELDQHLAQIQARWRQRPKPTPRIGELPA